MFESKRPEAVAFLEGRLAGEEDIENDVGKTRTIYSGEEHGEIAVPLEFLLVDGALDIFPEIKAQGIFQFRFDGKRLIFQAGKYVGLIPINSNVTIEVKPRVPLRNLEAQLIKSRKIPKILSGFSRPFALYEKSFDALLDVLTDSLLDALEPIRSLGLHKEYRRREELSFHPKGRLDIARIARRSGSSPMDLRVPHSWFDREVNTSLNQCLLTALELLSAKYLRLPREKGVLGRIRRVSDAARLFHGVSTDPSFSFLRTQLVSDPGTIPVLRAYYAEPIAIAKAIILNQGISLSSHGDEFSLSSLLIDMSAVFEAYVRNALIDTVTDEVLYIVDGNRREDVGGGAKLLFLDDSRERLGKLELATPDIVVYRVNENAARVPEIVIDAKYKIAEPVAGRDDINQVVTYAVTYATRKAVLVMPNHPGTKPGLWYLGEVGNVRVYQYNFDLAATCSEDEESAWANAIRTLAIRGSDFIL